MQYRILKRTPQPKIVLDIGAIILPILFAKLKLANEDYFDQFLSSIHSPERKRLLILGLFRMNIWLYGLLE